MLLSLAPLFPTTVTTELASYGPYLGTDLEDPDPPEARKIKGMLTFVLYKPPNQDHRFISDMFDVI